MKNNTSLADRKIKVIINGVIEDAVATYSVDDNCSLTINLNNGHKIYSIADDIFSCFCNIRKLHPEIIFLCKGAKKNVYPSNMTRQMTNGILAYEYKISEPAGDDRIVNIFDFDNENISKSPEEQKNNHLMWLKSLVK